MAVEEYVRNRRRAEAGKGIPDKLLRPGMAFTTIETVVGDMYALRGCIGFLAPVNTLLDAVVDSAIEAAAYDPRFSPVEPEELDRIVVEVTVLSKPIKLEVRDWRELPASIIIGKHGLLIERGWFKGTLLPVVPVEYCWDEEMFLEETCAKAGLPSDCWRRPGTNVYIYEGRAFREKEPRGQIYERDLNKEYQERCRRG